MNRDSFLKFKTAIENYLTENGWALWDRTRNSSRWIVPARFGIHAGDVYNLRDAMDCQIDFDSEPNK